MENENVVHVFPGVYDKDMNTELYLETEAEITEAQYNAIKEGYGVTGPDFQILKKGSKYFLKGDMDIDLVKVIVDSYLVENGSEPVFVSNDSEGD